MTARPLALAIALSLALAGCEELMKFASPAPPPDPKAQRKLAALENDAMFEADIMVGRVEVMQEQTTRGLGLLGVAKGADVEARSDRDTYRRLSDAVERYNDLRTTACTGKVASGQMCGPEPFLPLWYAGRARPDVSGNGLKKAAEEMQDRMTPLWDAVCAKAKAKSRDEHFCAIE
jgi:hypothetical protein